MQSTQPKTALKRAIFDRDLTQRDIAAAVGLDPAELSRIVNGRLLCGKSAQEAIAAQVGLPVGDLFSSSGFAIAAPADPGQVAA
jgi:transcriptional regulator with XRE-family HTH domain